MKKINFGNLALLAPFFKPYKREVCFAFLALLVTAIMILFFGKAIKYLIDYGFSSSDPTFLNYGLLIFIGAVLVLALAGYFRSSLINKVAEKAIADLRKKAYNHIIRVSAEFFEINKTGDVISRLTVDTVLLYTIISNTISFLIRNFLLFIGGIIFLFLVSVKLSVISFVLIFLAITPIFIMGKKVKKYSKDTQAALAKVGGHVEETVNGVKIIQSYLCEEKESRNFYQLVDKALTISIAKIRVKSMMIAAVISLAFGGIAVVLWVGGNDVLAQKITSGELSSFIFYAIITAVSLVSLSQIAGQLQSASSAAGRIFEILNIESPVKEIETPQEFKEIDEINIKFENVDFHYPSRKNKLILEKLNLEIKSKEKIAIVGPSGSGKSTILQLLMRFYDVNYGSILLNDINIKSLSFFDLRKNFSYISQDCFIFSGTVFENIAYVDKSIDKKAVQKLIDENEALNFINLLPGKLNCFVGEKGVKLSGGERQRIAFARALIKNSPIFLLDEATSALDNQNEETISKVINEIAKDKTIITIAHKLSSIIYADKIIFVRDGKIIESGTHQELITKDAFYKKMYESELKEA